MHFADDVLKAKFLEVYMPYQESQADGKTRVGCTRPKRSSLAA
jgi:hypothetical protein